MRSNDNINKKVVVSKLEADCDSADEHQQVLKTSSCVSLDEVVTTTATGYHLKVQRKDQDGVDEIHSCVESDGDDIFDKPIIVPKTTPYKSAQRRWSLNFAKNRKYIYQKTINLMPSRRLRRK